MGEPRKSKVTAHAFQQDPDVPPDHTGRRWCRCGLPGAPGDDRHPADAPPLSCALPPAPETAREIDNRRLGEREDAAWTPPTRSAAPRIRERPQR